MKLNISNLLTLSRILVIPIIVLCIYLKSPLYGWLAFSLFCLASITDYFDGYLARIRNEVSNLGTFLDPIADKLLVASVILILTSKEIITDWETIPALIILLREIAVSGLREYLAGIKISVPVSKIAKLKTKVDKLRPTLIGKIAPNLILADSTEVNWIALDKVKSDFTLLIFWNDDCGHCKKEIPKYKKLYDSIKKNTDINFEVYAVGTSIENEGWRKFIIEQDLNWINVSDFQGIRDNPNKFIRERKTTINSINYRNTYDIFITPIGYLLDKDKKILIKQFDAKQLSQLLPILAESNKEKK